MVYKYNCSTKARVGVVIIVWRITRDYGCNLTEKRNTKTIVSNSLRWKRQVSVRLATRHNRDVITVIGMMRIYRPTRPPSVAQFWWPNELMAAEVASRLNGNEDNANAKRLTKKRSSNNPGRPLGRRNESAKEEVTWARVGEGISLRAFTVWIYLFFYFFTHPWPSRQDKLSIEPSSRTRREKRTLLFVGRATMSSRNDSDIVSKVSGFHKTVRN